MAYDFNGTNQYLTNNAPVTDIPLTIACWFFKNTSNNMALVSLSNTSATVDRYALLCNGSNQFLGLISADPATASQNAIVTTPKYNVSTWAHGACVFTSSTLRTAYFQGIYTATNTATVTPNGINQLAIGVRNNLSLQGYTNGRIAEVGIWNAALNAAEVASLAKGMTCDKVRPESLVFYAPLVRDLQDISGGLTITNSNGATVAPHPRIYP